MKQFIWPTLISLVLISLSYLWGGWPALLVTLMLSLLEISISFDNAVINAVVLKEMSPTWQQRFLTWGILIAVFGVRLLFPLIIIAFVSEISFFEIVRSALRGENQSYLKNLSLAHDSLNAFGGFFLVTVFLSFLIDNEKKIHWLPFFEIKLAEFQKPYTLILVVTLIILASLIAAMPSAKILNIVLAGGLGILLVIFLRNLISYLKQQKKYFQHNNAFNFLYLELLDASFSFDGIIGAFAITKDIVLIFLGLTIGALFVRTMTISLVKRSVFQKYRFLEHGAYYGIGILGFLMLANLVVVIPGLLSGSVCIFFIFLSVVSSLLYNRRHPNP